jgi:adenylate cyclase
MHDQFHRSTFLAVAARRGNSENNADAGNKQDSTESTMVSPPITPQTRPSSRRPLALLAAFARRHPFAGMVVVAALSNGVGSVFSFLYNDSLIVKRYLTVNEQAVFWRIASPIYNVVAYPLCIGLMFWLLSPLVGCLRRLRAGETVEPELLDYCRQRIVNLPFFQILVNSLGWLPGAVFFPLMIGLLGDRGIRGDVWREFLVSFLVSAMLAIVQTFFLIEGYLQAFLYPEFFRNARPAEVKGAFHIPFWLRLGILWLAVAAMPLTALLFVAWNFQPDRNDHDQLHTFAWVLFLASIFFSGLIFSMVGRDLLRWIRLHDSATDRIADGDFRVHIGEQRPDELGKLTDGFNDMALALERGRQLHDTFGQFVSPQVRDEIIARYQGLEVSVQDITVLFVDIRGFTRRTLGEDPARVGKLLNAFLTLALHSIERKGGYVNKFLGDGAMALFGATRPLDDHADLALDCAHELLRRLDLFNHELVADGQAPLVVGIGIHSGPALVGCFGATLTEADGGHGMRREFSAIGETVNLCQRIEQLTKTCGGPILLSERTRQALKRAVPLVAVDPQHVPGCDEPIVVHRVPTGYNARNGSAAIYETTP